MANIGTLEAPGRDLGADAWSLLTLERNLGASSKKFPHWKTLNSRPDGEANGMPGRAAEGLSCVRKELGGRGLRHGAVHAL
jgi:hypothetical protein